MSIKKAEQALVLLAFVGVCPALFVDNLQLFASVNLTYFSTLYYANFVTNIAELLTPQNEYSVSTLSFLPNRNIARNDATNLKFFEKTNLFVNSQNR